MNKTVLPTRLPTRLQWNVTPAQLNALYKASGESGRAGPRDTLCGVFAGDELICGARLLKYGRCWLLRNLCTHPQYRRQGHASHLLQALIATPSHQPLVTLPLPHLNDFYQRHGFRVMDMESNTMDTGLHTLWRQSRRRHKGIQVMQWSGGGWPAA
ncbi:MAG: hypothetical protein CMI02_01940 [Oceanospirillaceae bacterium]|nr:hypothetical protein [Oceanospirillaceae bacterium]MBT10781.1 hypothetical protein [Oceanospirillaceae bacterium]|tara:strand:- start:1305 stop:1772 length:468 start_codon:yes stop_codon:yes gene_type:complete